MTSRQAYALTGHQSTPQVHPTAALPLLVAAHDDARRMADFLALRRDGHEAPMSVRDLSQALRDYRREDDERRRNDVSGMTVAQLVAVRDDPAAPRSLRKSAGWELHTTRDVPADTDRCPQCGGPVHGVGPMTALGQDAACAWCDWRWEA